MCVLYRPRTKVVLAATGTEPCVLGAQCLSRVCGYSWKTFVILRGCRVCRGAYITPARCVWLAITSIIVSTGWRRRLMHTCHHPYLLCTLLYCDFIKYGFEPTLLWRHLRRHFQIRWVSQAPILNPTIAMAAQTLCIDFPGACTCEAVFSYDSGFCQC